MTDLATAPLSCRLFTLEGCGLAIGPYPRFRYDARGGGGLGQLAPGSPDEPAALHFAPEGLGIPSLNSRTTRWLGLPLPPGLEIAIAPALLAGQWQRSSGRLCLRFEARFRFRLGTLYQAPDLLVEADLTTDPLQSRRHRLAGQPLNPEGEGLLVGVAQVPPSGDPWLDRFLGLPDEALAVLRCRLSPGV